MQKIKYKSAWQEASEISRLAHKNQRVWLTTVIDLRANNKKGSFTSLQLFYMCAIALQVLKLNSSVDNLFNSELEGWEFAQI